MFADIPTMFRAGLARTLFPLFAILLGVVAPACAQTAQAIIADGKARAEIVVEADAKRSVRFAARELQLHLQQISGAKLDIVSQPRNSKPVKLYVGLSEHTRRLGITEQGLDEHGSYRIVSGDHWLAMVGIDEDFVPIEPYGTSPGHWTNGGPQDQWDKMTGSHWFNAIGMTMMRNYNQELDLWRFDKTGSANAVYDFLQSLGVRWYSIGEPGTIIPKMPTVILPKVDRTSHPNVKVRKVGFDRYQKSADNILWARRLGINHSIKEEWAHHGMRVILRRQEVRENHPEWYQLIQGQRRTRELTANASYHADGLLEEVVKYVRFVSDHYGADYISVMPEDGLTRICENDKAYATMDRGPRGWYSDYIWGFIVQVANEVAKTHPHVKIMCGAYSTYQLPPLKIDRLPDNVLVQITNGRPRFEADQKAHDESAKLRADWLEKTSNPLSLTMNYPPTGRNEYRPSFFPHVVAKGRRDVSDVVWREDNWCPEHRPGFHAPEANHLFVYVLGKTMWDPMLDIDALLEEYYPLYYGPAADEMKAMIEYTQANYVSLTDDQEKIGQMLALFDAAKAKVSPGTIYAQRLAGLDEFLERIRDRKGQLERGRGPVPEFRAFDLSNPKHEQARNNMVIDGKLDEPFWVLRQPLVSLNPETKLTQQTRFQIVYDRDAIIFGLRCEEQAGTKPRIATIKDGDPMIWEGDHVEILIETASHSFYQVVINPAGAVLNLDRSGPKQDWFKWSSNAEVGAHVGDGYWSLEVKLPVTADTTDPLHMVIGEKPKFEMPWHFNVIRKRVGEGREELSIFSPSEDGKPHNIMSFGKLYVGVPKHLRMRQPEAE